METILFTKTTVSAEETEAVGFAAAELALGEGCDLIALYGDLGAGKTAFTRGAAAFLTPGAFVSSPTYTVVNEYGVGLPDTKKPLFHFDLYRIEDEDSLDSIGFYDYFARGGVLITEWTEHIGYALPERYLKVTLEKTGENVRTITVSRVGDRPPCKAPETQSAETHSAGDAHRTPSARTITHI